MFYNFIFKPEQDLAEKLFTISLIDTNKKQTVRLSPSDELPLYAQCVDKALSESSKIASDNKRVLEHVRLNIEWRSYDEITK
jgi:hypothetical protein